MAYENLRKQLIQSRALVNKPVDTPIRGVGRLPAGRHDVTIVGVETLWLETRGYFEATFQAGTEQFQRFRYFLLDFDKKHYSTKTTTLVRRLFGPEVNSWFDLADADIENALQLLRGMRVGILLEQGDGYLVDTDADGYTLVNPVTRKIYGTGYGTVAEAAAAATTLMLQRSKITLKDVYATATDRNVVALRLALQTLAHATTTPCS